MDINLNSFSSNLLLIGLVLVGLCCLYLLYSNFTKVREIEELKRRVEDLKKIFLNQQLHNDETFSKINTVLFQTLTNGQGQAHNLGGSSDNNSNGNNTDVLDMNININNQIAKEVSAEIKQNITAAAPALAPAAAPTKTINLDTENDENLATTTAASNIVINKEGYVNENEASVSEKNAPAEHKEINIDLHDLDELDDANADSNLDNDMNMGMDMDELDLDETCEEIDADKLVSSTYAHGHANSSGDGDVQITKNNLFNLDTVNITNDEIFDDLEDTLSIATAPIDETNDIINHNSNFNLDDIQDIPDIDDIDNLETVDSTVKTVQLETTTLDNIDLNDLLNGNSIQTKKVEADSKPEGQDIHMQKTENIKTIDIDAPKTDYNSMSVKQLKDIAKSQGLKTTGTKQELIQVLLAHDTK